MTTLLIAEHDNLALNGQTAQALTAANALGQPVDILVAGAGCAAVASAAAALGAARVLVADDARYATRSAEALAALVVSLAGGYDAIVAAATSTGKDVLPRVAALLDVMQISDIVAVESADTFRRPIYAGNAVETVKSSDAKKVITVRASAFAATVGGGTSPVEPVAVADDPGLSRVVEQRTVKSDRPELTAAKGDRVGWSRFRLEGQVRCFAHPACRKAQRRHRREPCGRRCGLCGQRVAGRPDRQDRGA
jgi:electron transfer flavoprotein alpha subunit